MEDQSQNNIIINNDQITVH